jgi:hypothetical protein
MKTLAAVENVISVGKEVGDRLEQHNMHLQLTKKRPAKEMFSPEILEELSKNYNIDNMDFQFGICTFTAREVKP